MRELKTAEQMIAEGCAPRIARVPSPNLIADLTRMADRFRWTASRVGQPGCAVRRQAAEDEATIREAIALLRARQAQGEAA